MSGEYDREYFASRKMGRVLDAPKTVHDRHDAYVHSLPQLLALCSDLRVLDLGCGMGQGAWWLSQRCGQVTGIDSSTFAIEFAERNYKSDNLRFLEADVLSIDVPEASFDLILIMDLIEHLDSAHHSLLLRRCRRWLTEGGRLVIHAPIAESWVARRLHRRQTGWSLDHTGDPTHRTTFSVRELQDLVRAARFQIERQTFTYGRFIFSRSTLRLLGTSLRFLPPLRNQLVLGMYLLARATGRSGVLTSGA